MMVTVFDNRLITCHFSAQLIRMLVVLHDKLER
jgi:hypothetical protein